MAPRERTTNLDGQKKDRWAHYVVYVLGGGLIGGALDLFVFDVGTPLYGIVGGILIALIYIVLVCRPGWGSAKRG